MKNVIATLCLLVSTIALSACETANSGKNYAVDRTASYADAPAAEVAPAEEVFQKAQNK